MHPGGNSLTKVINKVLRNELKFKCISPKHGELPECIIILVFFSQKYHYWKVLL